ncbi:MAG: MTH938/NDUFAF3 family protein [Nitrospinota bacterium]
MSIGSTSSRYNCFKCGRYLGAKEEFMKMETEMGKICYECYNKYKMEEQEIAEKRIKIDSYSFGNIVIGGKRYTTDVIILNKRVISNWWRKEGHTLCLDDLKDVLTSTDPSTGWMPRPPSEGGERGGGLLIIGTGASGMMKVLKEVRDYFNSRGIMLIEERTEEACKTFNRLRDPQKVVATLHLTC